MLAVRRSSTCSESVEDPILSEEGRDDRQRENEREDVMAGGGWVVGSGCQGSDQERQARCHHRGVAMEHLRAAQVFQQPPRPRLRRHLLRRLTRRLRSRRWLISSPAAAGARGAVAPYIYI